MTTPLPPIHITLMQPAGYVHSLGLLDQARYVRYQLRRLGATVTLAKNRLREDSLNIVFGAHLGFPEDWCRRHACIFINLEQLGDGGAAVSEAYMKLLRSSAVADYDASNVAAVSSLSLTLIRKTTEERALAEARGDSDTGDESSTQSEQSPARDWRPFHSSDSYAGVAFVDITGVSRAPAHRAQLMDDGLHPSAAQYRAWIERVLPFARAALEAP